jgi:phosphatidylserine decarboxylase
LVEKGEELGLFTFGGSSIIVAFEPGRMRFCDDLREKSIERSAINVEVGMNMGTAC